MFGESQEVGDFGGWVGVGETRGNCICTLHNDLNSA